MGTGFSALTSTSRATHYQTLCFFTDWITNHFLLGGEVPWSASYEPSRRSNSAWVGRVGREEYAISTVYAAMLVCIGEQALQIKARCA